MRASLIVSATRRIRRTATTRYVLGVSLVVLASAFSFFLGYGTLAKEERLATLINLSGRQRMLSQRTALFAVLRATKESAPEREWAMIRLVDCLTKFEANHAALISDLESRPEGSPLAESLRSLYFHGSPPLTRELSKQFDRLHAFAALSDQEVVRRQQQGVHDEIAQAALFLVQPLDAVVEAYEGEARGLAQRLMLYRFIAFASTLLLVLLEVILIFRPMVRTISTIVEALAFIDGDQGHFQDSKDRSRPRQAPTTAESPSR